MAISRRLFIRNGVATVGLGIAAPSFLSTLAQAQTPHTRNLVVVYLAGGNDSLNTLVGYQDAAYYSRRPTIAVPANTVLQVGPDSSGRAMGLAPRLDAGWNFCAQSRCAGVQRTGYLNSSGSHFEGGDMWGT